MTQPLTSKRNARKRAKSPRGKVIAVNEELHAAIKAKAKREGRVMQKMVEEKLAELLAPEQLELAALPEL